VLATHVVLAAPGGNPKDNQAAPAATQPGKVAVVPFVYLGRADEDLTKSFTERLVSLKTDWKFVESASMASHLGKGVPFRSDTTIAKLLKAAKAAGAETLILGQASSYKFLDAPGVRLRVKMIAVASGSELHSSLAEETAWTVPGAKKEVARTAAKRILKEFQAE
jgi:hypothetical protein